MSDEIEIVQEEIVASIIYSIKNTGECIVDIDVEDFEDVTMQFFAHLFYNITSNKFSATTIDLIKDGFAESENPNLYSDFLNRIQEIAKIELKEHLQNDVKSTQKTKNKERKVSEEPCISPTDLLRGG